jgi:hypothetical protein
VDKEVPEKETTTNQSQQKVNLVRSFDNLHYSSVGPEFQNVSWVCSRVSFPLLFSIIHIIESHRFNEPFWWVSEKRLLSIIKKFDGRDEESLGSQKTSINHS